MDAQECSDRFYFKHGPCCAGCDYWQSGDSYTGDCSASAPVGGKERASMIGIRSSSLELPSGHIITKRDHHCGQFKDEFDWQSLSLAYRRRIGCSV